MRGHTHKANKFPYKVVICAFLLDAVHASSEEWRFTVPVLCGFQYASVCLFTHAGTKSPAFQVQAMHS